MFVFIENYCLQSKPRTGPDGTVIANDGWYYHIKMEYLTEVIKHMNCDPASSVYPTHMDGVEGWACRLWAGCEGGHQVVHCNGYFGARHPFQGSVDGYQIIWDFMEAAHKRKL